MKKQITKAMLPKDDPRVHVLLLCTGECRGEYSANPSDHFMLSDGHVFRHCRRLMRLVKKRTVYDDVT